MKRVTQPVRFLWMSMGTFLLTVAVCVLLMPHGLLSHSGLSYFAGIPRTSLVYGIGLGATAYFLLRGSLELSKHDTVASRSFRYGLDSIAIGIFGIIATPSLSTNQFVQNAHVLSGLVIFLAMAGLSAYYLIRATGEAADWLLLAILFVAIMLAWMSFETVGVLRLVLPSQLPAIMSFETLLFRAATKYGIADPT